MTLSTISSVRESFFRFYAHAAVRYARRTELTWVLFAAGYILPAGILVFAPNSLSNQT